MEQGSDYQNPGVGLEQETLELGDHEALLGAVLPGGCDPAGTAGAR